MSKRKYIHYGADKFDPNKFLEIKNQDSCFTKPKCGGLWVSPVNAKYGWKEWCNDENFHHSDFNKSFIFSLKENVKICVLRDSYDLKKLPKLKSEIFNSWYLIDFEKAKEKYDAIEFYVNDDLYFKLYGWDCNCVLVLNKECINA